jgi:3-hydroxyacyl-[acyl-carrier-protein] dehydratase
MLDRRWTDAVAPRLNPATLPADMRYQLIDDILERSGERVVARKMVSLAEEYLADHFPTFPLLPGVLMLEAMVQAARVMLSEQPGGPHVLGEVKAMKYGAMVRPGESLRVEVQLDKTLPDGSFRCRGTGIVERIDESDTRTEATAVSGRFTMRPIRTGEPPHDTPHDASHGSSHESTDE